MNRRRALILSLIFLIAFPVSVQGSLANLISDVSTLDLSSGQIVGEKAEYYFLLPTSWQGKIIVERENLNSQTLLEKVDFYYKPENKVFKPAFLFSLFIYDKKEWSDNLRIRKLLETDRYVFCVYANTVNNFGAVVDKTQFQRLISDASDNQFIKNCIVLANGVQALPEYTVTVNGNLLEGSNAIKKGSTVFLPLRSICQAMGYQIGWSDKDRAILILRGNFYYEVLLDNNIYDAYLEDGKTYLSSMFFIQIMRVNVEIDDRCNVYIRER